MIHVLWINAGLSCDGDSVALTAATQPSVEEIALGALPGLPKVAVHWPLIDFECGPTGGADDFLEWFFKADRGELEPFVLVVEGSIPNEKIKEEGYWCGFGNDPATGQPMTTSEWIDRLAPKACAVVAVGTCATYGGIHAMAGNPTGCMGVADYLGWEWKIKAGLPIVNVPGCPVQPDNFMETLTLPALPGGRAGADDPAGRAAAAQVAVRGDRARGLRPGRLLRAGRVRRPSTAQPKCLVKLGCWGPVVNCNVPKRGWIGGIGGCPNVGGICIGCTMPGFPGQVHAVHGRAAGRRAVVSTAVGLYGSVIRSLRGFTERTAQQGAASWRHTGPNSPPASRTAPGSSPPGDRLHSSKNHGVAESIAMATIIPEPAQPAGTRQARRDVLGPDHPDRGQPGHLHQDRFREPSRSSSATARRRSSAATAMFMKGKDPRDAHFITSRICGICGDNHATCSCYAQNMAYGVRPPRHRRVDHQPGRGGGIHVRPQHLPGQPGGRGLLRADGQGDQPERARPGGEHRARRTPTIHGYKHHRRHHADAQSVQRASSTARPCR